MHGAWGSKSGEPFSKRGLFYLFHSFVLRPLEGALLCEERIHNPLWGTLSYPRGWGEALLCAPCREAFQRTKAGGVCDPTELPLKLCRNPSHQCGHGVDRKH